MVIIKVGVFYQVFELVLLIDHTSMIENDYTIHKNINC